MSDVERSYLKDHLQALKAKTDPNLENDIFFERFCTQQILKPRDLDINELALGYVRGEHDGGIDSAYFFCDSKLVKDGMWPKEFDRSDISLQLLLIQATTSPNFGTDRIRKFEDVTTDLLDLEQDVEGHASTYNHELRTIIKRFRTWYRAFIANAQTPKLNVTFYYASQGDDVDPEVEKRAEKLKKNVQKLYVCDCDVKFVNAKRLLELALQTRSEPVRLDYVKELSSDVLGDAYVCLVPLKAFVSFITTPTHERREYLLEPNVRGYLGSNDVNKKIRDTLKGAQNEEFWWLNNGVTIVAAKVDRKTSFLKLTRPRIVNGLQTSREIYNYARDNEWNISDDPRHLMVRVIEAKDKEVMNHIIKTTNSQTRIKQIFLHTTEDIHFRIEMAFPAYGLYYERVKNQWFDEASKPTGQIITFSYLMKALMAILLRAPDQARGRPDMFGEKEYKRLFQDSYKPELYAGAALLMKRVDEFLGAHSPAIETRDLTNLKYYVAMYAGCRLSKSSEPTASKIGQIGIAEATDVLLEKCLGIVNGEYRKLIKQKPADQVEDNDPDQIAKGTQLAIKLRAKIAREFPPHRRMRKVGATQEAKAKAAKAKA